MEIFNCILWRNSIQILLACQIAFFPVVLCFGTFHQKSSEPEITTQIGPSQEDKEILQEALHLLNMGKKTLGLSTVNPQQVMQLVNNSNAKDTQIRNILQKPLNHFVPNSEQYMVLSGKNGHIQLVNYTNTTFPPEEIRPNNSVIEDLFKITMEKKSPIKTGKGKVFHRITIIETNQQKPFDEKNFPRHIITANRPSERHKMSSVNNPFSLPRIRTKRMKHQMPETDRPGMSLRSNAKNANEKEDSINQVANLESSRVPLRRHRIRSSRHFHSLNYPKSTKVDTPQLKKISFLEEYGKIGSVQEYSGNIGYSLNFPKPGQDNSQLLTKDDNYLESDQYRKIDSDQQYSGNLLEQQPSLETHLLLSRENAFINRVLRMVINVRRGEERTISFKVLAIIILILAVLTLLVFLLYR
nr:uncharacterized protein LOC107444158 [Parasteatoda tepidariorum]